MIARSHLLCCSRLLWIAVLTSAVFSAGSLAAHAAVRVALMNIYCEDNSYRSTVSAMDFTAAIQAELSTDRNHEWVERAEVEKTEAEFKLAGLGLIDRSEAIRNGRWLKADWAVFGRISTNSTDGRTLGLEIVDLQHADLLAATNLPFAPRAETHFKASSVDVTRVASALRLLLERASRTRADSDGRIHVALLFLSHSGSGMDITGLEERLRGALAVGTTTNRPIHIIQFERSGAAMDEANLVLAGLAQTDVDAWEKVANEYIWGKYSVFNRRSFDHPTKKWQDKSNAEVVLNLWDGKSHPRIIAISVTNFTSDEVLVNELVARIVPLLSLGRPSMNPLATGVRRRISESLATHAVEVARNTPNLWLGSREGVEKWLQVVKVLETACFFDPGNATARELWARIRWGRRAAEARENEFFFARRRSEAWRRHVEQFGFQTLSPAPPHSWWNADSIASEYVLSAWRPFEMFKFSQYNQAEWGVPRDAGGRELLAWQRQYAVELFARLLSTPDAPEVSVLLRDLFYGALAMNRSTFVLPDAGQRQRILEALWPRLLAQQRADPAPFDEAYRGRLELHFEQLGQPDGARAWLAQLDEIAKNHAAKLRARPVQLPRASTFDEKTPQPRDKP